jgi:hypothetical protein
LITEDEKGNKLKLNQQEFTKESILETEILPHGGFVIELNI